MVEELPAVKSEPLDEEPPEKVRDSKATGVSKAVPAPATPDSSEDSSSEEEQQEAKPEATSDQLRGQKTATPAPAKPPVISPAFPGLRLREEARESSSRPPDPPVIRGQPRGEVIAVLTLVSTCQRMLTYRGRLASGSLPGNMVIVHEDRSVVEFKVLMHRSGYTIRIVQNSLPTPDGVVFKVLNKDLDITVQEEPLPVSPNPPTVRYTMNRNIVGNMIVHDPTIPCTRTDDVPHLISFVSSEDSQKIFILVFYGNTLTVAGPQGRMIGEIRNSLRLGPEISLAGLSSPG